MTDDRQEDVAFRPMRIGRRRRGPDPFLIGVAVVVGGLLLSVIKPWEGAPTGAPGRSSSPPAATSTSSEGTPIPQVAPEGALLFDDPLATVAVLDALEPRDEWGVRAVGAAPAPDTGFRERWTAGPLSASGGRPVTIPAGEPVLAIGITTPADETPLDVRVFGSVGPAQWSWLDVHRVTTDRPLGSLLLRPPRVLGSEQATWPMGTYRVELLMGTFIETIDLTLPYPTGLVPPPPVHLDPPIGTINANTQTASVRETGPVLMDGHLVLPLDVEASDALDPARAWLVARVSSEDGPPAVATIREPFARTLAVMLPRSATDIDARLSRLSPIGVFDPPRQEVATELDRGTWSFVAFGSDDGPVFEPGTYAVRVRWRDDDARHDQTWHVTFLPGEPDPEPAMLRAARAFDGFAGRDGIVIGPSFGPTARPDGYFASYLAFERSVGQTEAQPIACGETFIGGKPEVVGISHPGTLPTIAVRMELLVPGGESRTVPLRTADLAGMTLVEPARGASFAQGVYRLAFEDAFGGATSAMVCLGTSPFEG